MAELNVRLKLILQFVREDCTQNVLYSEFLVVFQHPRESVSSEVGVILNKEVIDP